MMRKVALLLALAGLAQGKMAPKSFVPRHALSVRGGSDPIVETGSSLLDPDVVAKAGIALNVVQGVIGSIAPAKTGEMYGLKKVTGMHELILERVGVTVLVVGLQAYWLLVKESSLAEAVGVSIIPLILSVGKSLLSGTPKKVDFPDAAEYLNLAIGLGVAYVGLTDASCFDTVLKVLGVWLCANGVFLGFMPEDGGKAWGMKSPTEGETFQLKVLGYWLLSLGVYDLALSQGVEGLKAFGYSWIPLAALSLMINFVTKEVDSMKMDSIPQYVWLLVEALVIGTLAL